MCNSKTLPIASFNVERFGSGGRVPSSNLEEMKDGMELGERDEFVGHVWNCVQNLANYPLSPFPAFTHLR